MENLNLLRRHINFLLVLFELLVFIPSKAQLYKTQKSEISFFSEALIEDIEALNTKAVSIFNSDDGEIAISIPIKEFQFDKSLMQEHFNEKYMESDKYPKATFQGHIIDFKKSNEIQQVLAEGELTIHGVKRKVELIGELEFKENKVFIVTSFQIRVEDHKIKIPRLLFQNIAEIVDVKVNLEFEEYSN